MVEIHYLGFTKKAIQLFMLYNTLPQNKLWLASFRMEGKAMVWYQDLENSGIIADWEIFVKALLTRFDTSIYYDLMETLMRLRQLGSIEEYNVEFEHVSNRLRQLLESHKLSYFLTGLKYENRLPAKMFNPPDLGSGIDLVKIQEEHVKVSKKLLKGLPLVGQTVAKSKMYLVLINIWV